MAVRVGYKNVYRYAEGFSGWKQMGLPHEKGDVSSLLSTKQRYASGTTFGMGLLLTLTGIFLGGVALNLTPCVYPLIPITASYFGCRIDKSGKCEGSLVIHGLLYILGLSFMNSILGVTAAFSGKLMGSILQHSLVLIFVSSILLFMSLSFFGLWELRMPVFFNRILSKSYTGYFGSLFMGLTLGIVAAPCIGPFIIGLLTMVAQKGDQLFGFLVFFVLSIGLGLPLFILSIFAGNISKLPRSGEWMVWIRMLFGWTMFFMAFYFIKPLIPSYYGRTIVLSMIVFIAGLHLGFISKIGKTIRNFVFIKMGAGFIFIFVAIFFVSSVFLRGEGVLWKTYSQELLQEAKTSSKPVIIDFYADWCSPCRTLEEKTFHDKEVVQKSKEFLMIKIDLTGKRDKDVLDILQEYNVKGVPTVVFLDSKGDDLRHLRIVDYVSAEDFLTRMKKAMVN